MAKRRSKPKRQKNQSAQKKSPQQVKNKPTTGDLTTEKKQGSLPWGLIGGAALVVLALGIILPRLASDPKTKSDHPQSDASTPDKGNSVPLGSISMPRSNNQHAAAQQNLDPRSDGWGTEADAEQAKKQLSELLELAVARKELDPSQLHSLSPEFICKEIRPTKLIQTFDDASIRIWKGSEQQAEIVHKNATGFAQALSDFVKPLRDLDDIHTHVKVVRITATAELVTTEAIIETGGKSSQRSFGQHSNWTCQWEKQEDSLLLCSVQVDHYQEITASGPGGFLFTDGTEETLAEVPSYETQLRHRTDYWLERIEKRLGISRFGHHGVALGDVDLYVANDFGRNNLYQNEGGMFTDVAAEAGVEDVATGMSVSWGDYNHDGHMDVYIGNMFSAAGNRITFQREFKSGSTDQTRKSVQRLARGNSLFENSGDGTFRDVSETAGVTMGRWAWASVFADINNDGWEDLMVTNGYLTQTEDRDL